ncbi:MAG: hypothetical protein PHF80_04000 [Methanothrix sp.]|nr:hypothetical protein [Methanothrix sp.]
MDRLTNDKYNSASLAAERQLSGLRQYLRARLQDIVQFIKLLMAPVSLKNAPTITLDPAALHPPRPAFPKSIPDTISPDPTDTPLLQSSSRRRPQDTRAARARPDQKTITFDSFMQLPSS